MKKLTDTLSEIKNIFHRQQNSDDAIPVSVEFTDAADKTRGHDRGNAIECSGGGSGSRRYVFGS